MNPDSQIIIVGAGAFGTSTAYHLSLNGFKNVRVLDRYAVPSVDAAATDINKVIRSDYNEPLYAKLGIEAIEAWRSSPLFKDLYHVPGWILSAADLSVPFVEGSIETSKKMGVKGLEELTRDQIRERYPVVKGALDGWNINVWNPTAGWASAGEALCRMALAAQENGVEYISGDKGFVRRLLYSSSGECNGVVTQDGSTYTGDGVVLAAGAWTPTLVDVEGQLISKGHSVVHLHLNPEETKRYSTIPILDSLELGYIFPPQSNGVMKLAHSQYIVNHIPNTVTSGSTTSVPHTFITAPTDDLPLEIEASMRRNLRRVLPELADRPFPFSRLCWDADTPDRHFLIAPHPGHRGLYLATGGSAHGFKFMPVLGQYIVDMLRGTLDQSIAHAWRWRPGQQCDSKNLAHMDPELELSDLTGWRGRRLRENRMGAAKL